MNSRPHPYDEDFEPTVAPWLTFVPLMLTRAKTRPIDANLLSALIERCEEK